MKYSALPTLHLPLITALVASLFASVNTNADGVIIDKVYHPYVEPLEKEFEWRVSAQDNQPERPNNIQLHRFAYGQSINDYWFVEAYIIGEKSSNDGFEIEAYELETKWQLTEQGEFWADYGLLFELEKEAHEDIWEFATGLLIEKEWGNWSNTANLIISQEWGGDISDELETSLALQSRYRYSRSFEPAIEVYVGEDTQAIGPAFLGQIRLDTKHQIKWEAGILFGLDEKSPNNTLRIMLEYEFY
jgi:hypothetical protein